MTELHLVVFVEPDKANMVLAELALAKALVTNIAPFLLTPGAGQVVMIAFAVDAESEDAEASNFFWLEDTIGPNCIIY